MNKGLKLLYCKVCGRNRYHSKIVLADYRSQWTCSKGHSWVTDRFSIDTVNNVIKETLLKKTIGSLFSKENAFYEQLRRK